MTHAHRNTPILESPFFDRVTDALRFVGPATGLSNGVAAVLGTFLPPPIVARWIEATQLTQLLRSTLQTSVLVGGLFIVFFSAEQLAGAGRAHYRTRVFARDVLYAFFYQGGLYVVLLWAGLANLLGDKLAVLRVEALAGLPGWVHWLVYWIAVDFITYWWHRALHSWGPLWALHSVHHSQEDMSFISSYRLHPLEQLFQNLIMVVPLLLMGVPTFRWLPLYAVMALFEAAQHSALPWGYGALHRVFVSPIFHAVHHSSDPKHHNRNFSKIFSAWDFLFGTGIREASRPERFGVDGIASPQSVWQQLIAPFRLFGGGVASVARTAHDEAGRSSPLSGQSRPTGVRK